jgi:NAD(P)-dependent dehydrogenase (short-subunit alcohol dehydrogenase family)
LAEVFDAATAPNEICYSADGSRMTCSMTSEPFDRSCKKSVLSKVVASDVFLVTGGARGITPHCLREIAARVGGGVTYILMGRSPLEQVPEWAKGAVGTGNPKDLEKAATKFLKEGGQKVTPAMVRDLAGKVAGAADVLESLAFLEKAGARVIYTSCDVSGGFIASTLGPLMREHSVPRITGLIHASGVLRDKKIENKTGADLAAVYGTKFDGLMNVLGALQRLGGSKVDLRHILLFSSLAGFCGNAAQADYAMANEALNKYAQAIKTASSDVHVAAFDFGPWDAGMVDARLKKHFEDNNVEVIPLDGGAKLVAEVFCDYQALPQVLFGNWMELPVKTFAPDKKVDNSAIAETALGG